MSVPDYRLNHLRAGLGNRYEFEAFLGRGAFAAVFLVKNLRLQRREALKVLYGTYEDDKKFTARFIHEARLVASLDHPNIVQVYDYGQVDGIVWYSMQYIDGPTLRAELKRRPIFDLETIVHLAIPLLDALGYSHAQGIIHRDIKPNNVILNQRGRPFIMDFGIAKSDDSTIKTLTSSVLGTPAYMAPEQAGGQDLDGRADLYSLATVMYEMATGRPPFESKNPLHVMLKRIQEQPAPPSQFHPVDPHLEKVILRGLANNRQDRFESAASMRDALVQLSEEGWQRQRPIATAPETQPLPPPPKAGTSTSSINEVTTRKLKRSPVLGFVLFAALCLAILLGVAFKLQPPSASQIEPEVIPAPEIEQHTSPQTDLESPSIGNPTHTPAPPSSPAPQQGEENNSDPSDAEASGPTPAEDSPTISSDVAETKPLPPPERKPPAAAPAAPPARQVLKPPRLIKQRIPEMDAETASLCANAKAAVTVLVSEDGQVLDVRILKIEPDACRGAVIATAKAFSYRPGQDTEGQPIEASLTTSIAFGEQSP